MNTISKLSSRDDLAAALGHIQIAAGKLEMRKHRALDNQTRYNELEVLKRELEEIHNRLTRASVLVMEIEEGL